MISEENITKQHDLMSYNNILEQIISFLNNSCIGQTLKNEVDLYLCAKSDEYQKCPVVIKSSHKMVECNIWTSKWHVVDILNLNRKVIIYFICVSP